MSKSDVIATRRALGVRPRIVWLGVAACIVAACDHKPAANTARTDSTATASLPVAPAINDSTCPRDAKWKSCLLIDRLRHAGVAPTALDETTKVAFLKPSGIRFRIGTTGILVAFYFSDSAAAALALATLDTLRFVPKGDTARYWPSDPAVIRSVNLVAAMFSESPRQIERVRLAITAGAPQPPMDTTHKR